MHKKYFCFSVHAGFSLENKHKVTVQLIKGSASRLDINTIYKKKQRKENKPFLTCHGDEVKAGVNASHCVPGFAEIIPTVLLFNVSEGKILTGPFSTAMTFPVPDVASFRVSIAAAV